MMSMPVNPDRYNQPAKNGDLSGIAINTQVALWAISLALQGLKNGEDIAENIEQIRTCARELDEIFNRVTGWTPNTDE